MQNVASNMLLCCNSISEFVASRYVRFRVQKAIENARKRVLSAVNRFLFSKMISNEFTTVYDIVFDMLLYCNNISEYVAARYARFRVQKTIENARKRVLDAVNRAPFCFSRFGS